MHMIDNSIVRVPPARCVHQSEIEDSSWADHAAGLTSKTAVVDTNGLPVQLALNAGRHMTTSSRYKLLSRLKSGSMLLADRGYDADWIRDPCCKEGRAGQPRFRPACVDQAMAAR